VRVLKVWAAHALRAVGVRPARIPFTPDRLRAAVLAKGTAA
jgi:hypothetical protein